MALICTTSKTWVQKRILDRIDNWVRQRKKACKRKKWWQRFFCWFFTILVQVISWVVRYILVPVLNTICVLVTWIIGALLLPFAVAIDAITGTTNAADCVRKWFITPTKITFVSKEEDPKNPKQFRYTFTCNCNGSTIVVLASSDTEAQSLAIRACKDRCK